MEKKKNSNSTKKSKLKELVQNQFNKLYSGTYFSPKELNNDTNNIRDNINTSLNKMLQKNDVDIMTNTKALYERISENNKQNKMNDLDKLLDSDSFKQSIMPSLLENKYLKQYDDDIDTLCKFLPTLDEALEIKADHVMSADKYTKKFMSFKNKTENDTDNVLAFDDKMESIKSRYNLELFLKKSYKNAAKYGEEYIYITSYKKAFSKLLNNKNKRYYVKEAYISTKEIINESSNLYQSDLNSENNQIKIRLYNGIIPSSINETTDIIHLQEQFLNESKFDSVIDDNLNFESPELDNRGKKIADTSFQDGLITKDVTEDDIKINEAVLRRLKRENIVPLYIGDICIAYAYIECNGNIDDLYDENLGIKNRLGFLSKKGKNVFNSEGDKKEALNTISGKLTKLIDVKFINNNQDIKKDIYMILQQNNLFEKSNLEINMSIIPSNDIIPIKFNEDEETHRGVSDLDKALLVGKLCAALRTTNTIGMLTRGFDKRVYYVKQQIDTNISQVLLNTINQLKKSNYGAREISNLKNLLNMSGKYQDLLIPVGPTGDYPVQFEVIPGQEIDPQTEFLESLEQQAVNTVVPYEYVQAESQVDFATRLTMSNVKFNRIINARQQETEYVFGQIVQRIWDIENPDNHIEIEVLLISPAYLSIVNNTEMYQYVSGYADNIVATDIVDDNDLLKKIYKKNIVRNILSREMNSNELDDLLKKAKVESERLKKKE